MMTKIVEKHERKIYRFLEILPGLGVWGFLLSPIWLGWFAPKIIIFYITALAVYWAFLGARHATAGTIGYLRYKKEMDMNWMEELSKLNFSELPHKETLPSSLKETKHFLLTPVYSEPKAVLKQMTDGLLSQTFPLDQVTLVVAMEERYAETNESDIRELLGKNINRFEEVLFYTHPKGIPNEAIGVAGANRTWGAKNAVGHLKAKNKDLRNYIFTTFDSDSKLNPQFLARLTHLYLSCDKRDNKFYSTAVHLFDNNIWKVPAMMRIEANSVTLAGLSDWIVTKPTLKESFSCYSASLQTLIDADYWDVQVGVDDTIFYWRAFFARDGDFEGAAHYIPYAADAVQSETYMKSHKSMYLQLRRWGWGTISMPMSLLEFMKNKKVPVNKKIDWAIFHFERKIVLFTLVFLMTFGLSLLTLVNQDARQINLVYTLPDLMSLILTGTMIFLLPITILRTKLIAPMPKEWSFIRKALTTLIDIPLVIVNMLTFSLIPWLDAYTRMMFGKRMKDLYHTPKVGNEPVTTETR